MTDRIKIAAVSYLNTLPFVYGIEHAGENLCADLLLAVPAKCADLFAEGSVDVALVPVAEVVRFGEDKIITDYCISADDYVRTVVLLSQSDVKSLKRIFLDSHSRTSRELVRILCREHWDINPVFEDIADYSSIDFDSTTDGYLLIGDKVFEYENRFKCNYDLCREWINLTGEPFVFAVWVAAEGTRPEVIKAISDSLSNGIANTKQAIMASGYSSKEYAYEYLTENIKFNLTSDKRRGMKLFLQRLRAEKTEPSSHLSNVK